MNPDQKRIIALSDSLQQAADQIKVLRNISWASSVKEDFFRNKAQKLPVVSYPEVDMSEALSILKAVRKELKEGSNIDLWAMRIADRLEGSALMLVHRGTKRFYQQSSWVYGKPGDLIRNAEISALDLAKHFDEMFEHTRDLDLGGDSAEERLSAQELADEMKMVVSKEFGDMAPEIVLDQSLASNALAGRRRISIRPEARFSDMDVDQLINHEIFVHIVTSLNGHLQPHLKILGEAHAGTTKTQEGLAIFAEYITNSIDLDRFRRLSDRVLAIQMAIDGADFIEVYRYYLNQIGNKDQAYENARRVFRGGVISGGGPFTKDIVYLEGLLTVHSFLRLAMLQGRIDYLDLLFCGKMDIIDLPVMKELKEMGLIEGAKFLPPWMRDKRYLLTYLSYSAFLDGLNLEGLKKDFEHMMNA